MIFVLFLIDLLAFGGFIWLLIMYLQSQYGDRKTYKNIIPYMFTSLIVFCIGIFGMKLFSSIEYSVSSNNTASSDTQTAEVKKTTPKKKHVKKHVKKKVNPNIVKIKAVDSSNVTYNKDDVISSPNMDNVFTFNVITASPVTLSSKIDDESKAKVLNFQMINSNEYTVTVKMLKDSEDDIGTDINLYYTNNGYQGKTDFQLTNYNSNANENDKPTTTQIKKFKGWVDGDSDSLDDTLAPSEGSIEDSSYNENTNTVNITMELEESISGTKSEIRDYESETKKKAQEYDIDPDDLVINFYSESGYVLVASKPKNSSLKFYKAFYKYNDDIDD